MTPTKITIGFEKGDAVSINGERLSPATLLGSAQRLWAATTALAGSIWWRTGLSA
jgi:argininosuccinate synthase